MRSALFRLAALIACHAALASASNLSPANTVVWTGPFGQGFSDVQGIAVDPTGQFVYVADADRVYEYDSNGVFVRSWGGAGTGPGQFAGLTGMAIDPFGDVYVVDAGNARVQKFDETGKFLTQWSNPGAHEIAADPFGTLYVLVNVLFSSYPYVSERAGDGTEIGFWPAQFPDDFVSNIYYLPHYANSGTAIASDAAGNAVVGGVSFQRYTQPDDDTCARQVWDYQPQYDQRPLADPLRSGEVVTYSSQGAVQAYGFANRYPFSCTFVSHSSGDIQGIAVDPTDGSVFVSVAQHYIQRMTASGGTFSRAGELDFPCLICQGLDTNFGSPRDMAFDCAGNLYVTSASQVLKFRNAGALPPPCGQKRRRLELALSPVVRFPKGKPGKMSLGLGCTEDECNGVVKVTTKKPDCPRCPLVVAKQKFHIMGGSPALLELTVRRAALPLVGQVPLSLRLAAKARAPHAGHRSVVVPEAIALASAAVDLVCPTGASAGVAAVATGTLDPAQATSIAAQIEAPDGTTTAVTVDADAGGHFGVPVTPDRAGEWTVHAGFAGGAAVDPASGACTFTVEDVLPAVQVVCPAAGVVGTAFEATGSIDPVRMDGQGGIEFAAPSGGLTVIPGGDASGMLHGSLVPREAGTWSVRGRWSSGAGAVAASSPCTVPVQPIASSLTLTCPTGMPLTFTGMLTPGFAGASIHISYAPAGGGAPLERSVTTAADGSFTDTLPVGTVNTGTAQASFAGDAGHGPASSPGCGF